MCDFPLLCVIFRVGVDGDESRLSDAVCRRGFDVDVEAEAERCEVLLAVRACLDEDLPLAAEAGLTSGFWSGVEEFLLPLPPPVWFPAARVLRLSEGCKSSGRAFVLPDRLLPPSMKVVGPSAENTFHGGETARGLGRCWGVRESVSLRRLLGRSLSRAGSCPFCSSDVSPFCSVEC